MIIDNHFKKFRSCHVFEKAYITNFELYEFKIKVKTLICPSLAVAIIKNKPFKNLFTKSCTKRNTQKQTTTKFHYMPKTKQSCGSEGERHKYLHMHNLENINNSSARHWRNTVVTKFIV